MAELQDCRKERGQGLVPSLSAILQSCNPAMRKGGLQTVPPPARILSRVIGRLLIRVPVALKIALAIAATDGMIGGSPSVFAPNGPYASSVSTKITSMSGASRWVATLAP